MKKTRTLVKALILTLPICMDNHACDVMKENARTQLTKEKKDIFQIDSMTNLDQDFLRFYEIVKPTEQETIYNLKRSRREAQAIQYLQKTRLVPATSLNVAIIIYLEDSVGKEPTVENIATTLSFFGLESVSFVAPASMK